MSLSEAQNRLGMTRSHVAYFVKTGKLEAMQTIVRRRDAGGFTSNLSREWYAWQGSNLRPMD